MSADELNTLREEVAPVPEATMVDAPADIMAPVDPGLVAAMSMVVTGLSAPICRKAKVTPVEKHEADMLGQALAQLVTIYDLGPKDPKGAAWMGLGMALVGVVGARVRLPEAKEEEAKIDAPPPPTFGSTGQTDLGIVETPIESVPCG